MPHMLNAAPEYTRLIKGQNPDPEKHQIFIEVEPVSLYHEIIN